MRSARSRRLLAIAVSSCLLGAALPFLAPVTTARATVTAGPVSLDGMDPINHGSLSSGGALVGPAIYEETALGGVLAQAHKAGAIAQVAVLGTTYSEPDKGTAGKTGAIVAKIAADLGVSVVYASTATSIDTLFAQINAGTANPAVLWIPDNWNRGAVTNADGATNANSGGTIDDAFARHATDIANFVNNGGGLFSNSGIQSAVSGFTGNGYAWLTALFPQVVVRYDGVSTGPYLTTAGHAAYPNLTNAIINAMWHNSFQGSLGSLGILADNPNPDSGGTGSVPVIVGGASVQLPTQTITFAQPPDSALSAGTRGVTATASSGLAVTFASSTTAVCTVAGTTVTLVSRGTCTLTASQNGDSTHTGATAVTQSFNVTTPQTITFPQPPTTALAAGSYTLGATASSGFGVTYTSSTTGVCTVSGSLVTLVSNGTCTIVAAQAGGVGYTAAPAVTQSFTVTTPQTITLAQPGDTSLSAGTLTVAPTATSGLVVGLSSSTQGVCTVTGLVVSLLTIGTCTLTAAQPGTLSGGGSVLAAAPVTRSFAVITGQTITFPTIGSVGLATGTVGLTATATSGLSVTYTTATTGVCTVAGSTVTLLSAGTCTVDADQVGAGSFTAAPQVAQSFQVTVPQTITFASPGDIALSGGTVMLMGSADSGLPVAWSVTTPAVCSIATDGTLTPLLAGTCTITAAQPGDATRTAAPAVTRSFFITVPQTITFAPPGDIALSTVSVLLAASADSGLTPGWSVSTPAVCTVAADGTVTLVTAGTCTVTATQPGDATRTAAVPVTRSFEVTVGQTITFTQPAATSVTAGTVALTASADSALPVDFTSSTPAVCTVSGSTATLVGVGVCTVSAHQPGSGLVTPAPTVTRSFTVGAAAPPAPAPSSPPAPAPSSPPAPAPSSAPAPPAVPDLRSTGVGPADQTIRVTVPAGGSLTLLDAGGSATLTVTVPGVGTYTADGVTGTITFTPVTGFTGTAPAVTFRVTDRRGGTDTATDTATVLAPPPPVAPPITSRGAADAVQHGHLPVPAGDTATLLDRPGNPVLRVTVAHEGRYVLDATSGVVTFSPVAGYRGAATGIRYRIADPYGHTATATYRPFVAAVSAIEPPAAGLGVAAVNVLGRTDRRTADRIPVSCSLSAGRIAGCTVTLYAMVEGRRVAIARGQRTVSGAGADARMTLTVLLTALGRTLAAAPGGVPVTAIAAVLPAGGSRTAYATGPSRVVDAVIAVAQPVFFGTSSAVLTGADKVYLDALRSRLSAVQTVVCTGYTDSRGAGGNNLALGRARARSTCSYLLRGTSITAVLKTLGAGHPFSPNTTPRGLALNRRAQMVLRS